jgi:pilus assembly protein CpaB
MKQKNLILMVVAVGCGLVAAFLTANMSAKGQIEQVDVVVADKDLAVGTMLTREELTKSVKTKKMPKDALPPAYVSSTEELVDKRLARPVRAGETFNPQDLTKGGVITLPEGMNMISLQVSVDRAAAGFVGPGSRVNVLATCRLGNKIHAFPLLVNMLVVAVDTHVAYTKDGTFPSMNTVSFAVTEKQALLLSLAKTRGCSLELMLRHPSKTSEDDKEYDLDKVVKLLQDEKNFAKIVGSGDEEEQQPKTKEKDPDDPIIAPPPTAKTELVKVLIANRDIAPNTMITKDLIAEAFTAKELPKDFAGDAYEDLTPALDKALKNGLSKGQWVTPGMVGLQSTKSAPPEEWIAPKPGVAATPNPVNPVTPPAPVAVERKRHDVMLHTTSGTLVIRYEEVAPGQWKKVAELTPEQAAKEDKKDAAKPSAAPKKAD